MKNTMKYSLMTDRTQIEIRLGRSTSDQTPTMTFGLKFKISAKDEEISHKIDIYKVDKR